MNDDAVSIDIKGQLILIDRDLVQLSQAIDLDDNLGTKIVTI